MALKIKFFLVVILFIPSVALSQSGMVNKGIIQKDKLEIRFCNNSDSVLTLPKLELRKSPDSKFLYSKYYEIRKDTLKLLLTSTVHTSLLEIVHSKNAVKPNAEISGNYSDKVLNPGKCFWSKSRILNLSDEVKTVLVFFDNHLIGKFPN